MNFSGVVRINKCGIISILIAGFILIFYAYKNGNQNINENLIHQNSRANQRVSLKEILLLSIDLARSGGKEIIDVKNNKDGLKEKLKGKTKEGVNDPVTDADFRSHKVMYYGMKKAYPGIKVISEEHTEEAEIEISGTNAPSSSDSSEISNNFIGDEYIDEEDITVWIDPLDATKEYTENLLNYVSTMICVAIKGVPILGVIHFPFSNEIFWAVVGFGQSSNVHNFASNLTVTQIDEIEIGDENKLVESKSPLRIIVSRSHTGGAGDFVKGALDDENKYKISTAAGSGFKVTKLLTGEADVYLHITDIKKWDLCAGNAILNAINGKMLTLEGNTLDYSADSDPLNTKGIISFIKNTPSTEKLASFKETS